MPDVKGAKLNDATILIPTNFCVTRTAEIPQRAPPLRDDSSACSGTAGSCHPEPVKTAKDLSRGDGVTRTIARRVVNPDATSLIAQIDNLCDVNSD
jgi:hypothetical protein